MSDYSEHVRAQALAALLAGQTFSEVARSFNVPIGTLKSWKSRSTLTPVSVDATEKRARIGTLLLEYVVSTLETLKAQQVIFADPEWLKKQTASEVAVLHGVLADKTIRLLEGLADASAPDADDGA